MVVQQGDEITAVLIFQPLLQGVLPYRPRPGNASHCGPLPVRGGSRRLCRWPARSPATQCAAMPLPFNKKTIARITGTAESGLGLSLRNLHHTAVMGDGEHSKHEVDKRVYRHGNSCREGNIRQRERGGRFYGEDGMH